MTGLWPTLLIQDLKVEACQALQLLAEEPIYEVGTATASVLPLLLMTLVVLYHPFFFADGDEVLRYSSSQSITTTITASISQGANLGHQRYPQGSDGA